MKRTMTRFAVLAVLVCAVMVILGDTTKAGPSGAAQDQKLEELWKKVQAAQRDGLPQTAIDHLKQIVALARDKGHEVESLRALTMLVVLDAAVKGNKPEEKVARFKAEVAKAPAALKPVMKLILAQWYWQYYSRNKWRFMDRTATAGLDDEDFTTWDLPRLFREVDSIYRDVLKDEEALKKTPLARFKDLIEFSSAPGSLRPTLFDFAAFEALEFYTSGEQAAAAPEDAFEIAVDSPALAPAGEFLRYTIETTDIDSPKAQALRIFQKVLAFHRQDSNKDVFLDADLQRLRFVKNTAVGEGAGVRYIKRLKEIAEEYSVSALASLAVFYWAQEVFDQGDYAESHRLADRGAKLNPSSLGASNCKVLLARIAAREFELRCESVIHPDMAGKLAVDYRNITTLHIRLVKENFADYLGRRPDGESLNWISERRLKALLSREPSAQWVASLKATADFKTATAFVSMPPLKPGFYRVLASLQKDFGAARNKVQHASFWVSDLGLVATGGEKAQDGYVVKSQTGEPVTGIEVSLYEWNYRDSAYNLKASARTDELGFYALRPGDNNYYRLLVLRQEGDVKLAETNVPYSYVHEERPHTQTLFFTDRSIYRPGQNIFFKGLCLGVDRARNDYEILPRRAVRVVFHDANRQEVAASSLVTNDFGTFSGSFVAPTDRLTGAMTISTENPRGSCSLRVEEYKRPKFQVKLDVPDQEYRLNDEVSIPGEAMAYTGAPIDGAAVKYRVVRNVQYPWWWYWGARRQETQEIGHGRLKTDALGKFKVVFKAKPDLSVPSSPETVFTYTVTVDVTDSAGETRSDEGSVRVGYAALQAGLAAEEWQVEGKPVVVTVITETLNRKKVAAQGVVEIYSLKGPDKPVARDLIGEVEFAERQALAAAKSKGFSQTPDWQKWPEGELVQTKAFATSVKDNEACTVRFELKKGVYKALLVTKDKFGAAVESTRPILVLNPADKRFPVMIPFHGASQKHMAEVGDTYQAFWGTGYEKSPVLVEVLQNNRWLQRYWTPSQQTQGTVRVPVEESLRGGFTVILSMVKDNRFYRTERRVSVPWSNKRLSLQWQSFRSKLQPGQKEKWSLQIKGPDALARAAEMVAGLYDASLDQFYGHGFPDLSGVFRLDWTSRPAWFANRGLEFQTYRDNLNPSFVFASLTYPRFPDYIEEDHFGYRYPSKLMRAARQEVAADEAAPSLPMAAAPAEAESKSVVGGVVGGVLGKVIEETEEAGKGKPPQADLSKVQARKNLNETAFFYPHLLADRDGVVTLEFTMPEALTEWRFLGFAHTQALEAGSIEARTVTQKDLMVQPNPPRFLREGDALEFTAKVTNMSEKEAKGAIELGFFDPRTEKSLDSVLGHTTKTIAFTVPAKQSRSFAWPMTVPDGLEVLAFKAVAATAEFQDGEEGAFPVLSRRILVRESIPLWISGKGEKSFSFEKLIKSAGSTTLQHKGLTLQMASNPAWYAVQALPFLMEFPYECSEQVFNRLYGNSLAQRIANSNPKIRRIFDQWKGTDALKSNLETNEDLKSVLLQESPWVLEAKNETQAKRNIGLLFDENTMAKELKSAFRKLEAMQLPDGSWPWFPGGPGNSYITLYITTGFGRLKHLAVASVSQEPAVKALDHLDAWIQETYENILKNGAQDHNNLSSTIALYLYGRSFFLEEKPVPLRSRRAVDYFLKQAAAHWLKLDWRQSQGHLALALQRFGDKATASKIMRSMKERSQVDEEMGRFWSELELSWWWYRAPIETQAVMIEAFDEVMNDRKAVEECKIWLLKQKQTQDWKTTKATADAVYGLLLKGEDLLASDAIVQVTLGRQKVEPEKVEAGTGFYEKRFEPSAIKPDMGKAVVKKSDTGIAWGGLHWTYMEDISKITPHAQNPLRLKKAVFVQRSTKKGPVIEPVLAPLAVGDTLIVRIELRTDRDMEYIHMRDHRGSGLEPVNVLSVYKYQGGLVYYEATKDTATHFFIDYLPKGTYVFEYPLRVVHRGSYQNGMAHIECMYAPEFNSHSESVKLQVK